MIFFCKITAGGPLVYWWYYWKMFSVNFYASCLVSRETRLGKNLIKLDWEKAVYRPLFTLANTLSERWFQNFVVDNFLLPFLNIFEIFFQNILEQLLTEKTSSVFWHSHLKLVSEKFFLKWHLSWKFLRKHLTTEKYTEIALYKFKEFLFQELFGIWDLSIFFICNYKMLQRTKLLKRLQYIFKTYKNFRKARLERKIN